jgi:3-phenylpropionate/trans-cinnamate dioxygenase ferredoxin subunit
MPQFIKVAKVSEITSQAPRCVDVGNKRIALFNLDGQICAIDDICTHEGGPLSEGAVEGDEVECPWHGARFNLKTGAACCPPAYEGVSTYKVRVQGDDVEIEI